MSFRWAPGIAGALAAAAAWVGAHAEPAAGPTPQVFAPGVISGPSNDGAPTFSPDGRTLLFERSYASWAVIFEAHRTGAGWSKPQVAAFSGPSSDQQPSFSPDGRYVVYPSSRLRPSAKPGGAPEVYTHLWRVDRKGQGWSEPVRLPDTVNISKRMFKPSIAANGDLYFMSADSVGDKGPNWRLYRSASVGGTLQPAVPLSFSDGTYPDVDPFIAPDQSYIIFSSRGRRTPDDGHEHLYIARRDGDGWGPVKPMRYAGDDWGADDGEAQVSPDGKTLYFTSGRSPPLDRKRTRAQMLQDVRRKEAWDNSNSNVWTLPLSGYLAAG